MIMKTHLSFVAAFLLAGIPSSFAAAKPRPNVLMIVIDDLNDWVGCLGGHPQARTPCMDALAASGTIFTNAQAQAPLCNPSRTSVLSGLRPSTTGIYGLMPGPRESPALKDWEMLPQHFSRNGYFTACFGKVYHDGSIPPDARKNEFEEYGPAPGMPMPKKKFVETPSAMNAVDWGVYPPDDHDYCDWKIADLGISGMASAPADRPFFIAVGFRLPHLPLFAPQKWFDLFPEDSVTLPPVLDSDRDDTPRFSWYLHWKLPEPRLAWLVKHQQWKPLVRSYLAGTSFMDSQIGRLMDALKASGKADNTVVVLWSDQGWHLGEKQITGKNTLWERSTHVPLIFAGPDVTKQGRCVAPAELLDIYPTLSELCGLPVPDGLEGHSLVPQLRDATAPREWPALTTANAGNTAVRDGRFRYIHYADGSEELYDEKSDPNEWTNLAADPEHSPVIARLAKSLPAKYADPAPGSAHRTLTWNDGVATWEGKPIPPGAPIPELDGD